MQIAIEDLLTHLHELPIGSSRTLADRAQDGFGGLLVKRISRHTFVFQRTGFQGRSRWIDGPDEAREEIEEYFNTGKLREPDNVKGW
ncbi:MAG TPA: hypothetical protein VGG59_05940 [Acidobacteriaceae bacterium]